MAASGRRKSSSIGFQGQGENLSVLASEAGLAWDSG